MQQEVPRAVGVSRTRLCIFSPCPCVPALPAQFCVCRTRKHTQKRARTHMHMQAHTCTRAHTRTRTHMSYQCISCIIIGVQAHLEHLKAPSQWAKDHAEDATSITIPSEKPRLFCLHGAQSVAPYRVRFHVGEGVGVGVWVRGLARVSSASML